MKTAFETLKYLDFDRPFMPESLARIEPLAFLTPRQRLVLNQIRGHSYLYILGLFKEFIVPASEESGQIDLFKRFRQEFLQSFGINCEVIGPPEIIAQAILSNHPLAVALVILHIEWMSQRHYLDSVADNQQLDPQFRSLLKHLWMEAAQQAKLGTLMVRAISDACSEEEQTNAIDGYLEIGDMLDDALTRQMKCDFESLQRATCRSFTREQTDQFFKVQQAANRWTFLGSGMSHSNFLATVELVRPGSRKQLEDIVPLFS